VDHEVSGFGVAQLAPAGDPRQLVLVEALEQGSGSELCHLRPHAAVLPIRIWARYLP
jgi:hypothetical protein